MRFFGGRDRVYLRVAIVGSVLSVLSAQVALAQVAVAPPTPPQELNPAARAPSPGQLKPQNDILAPPETGPCPFRDSSLTFTLTSVTFHGAEDLGPDAFASAYQGMIGQHVPVAAICDIRDRASAMLFHHGILARVDIPPQKMSKGALQLDVTEAYVAAVEVHGDAGPAKAKVDDYVEMLRGMKPFDINKAQRYLFLANDIPGVRIAATLKPSRQGPGAIDLDIEVTYTPVAGVLNVQNYNSRETGPWGTTARVDFNSLTELGDQTSLIGFTTPDFEKERVIQGIEQIRPGPEGLIASLSFAYGLTKPGYDLAPLEIDSTSYVGEFNLSYPLIRSRLGNLNLEGGFDAVDQTVDVFHNTQLSHDALRVLYVKADGNQKWRTAIPVSISGDIQVRKGLEILGASRSGEQGLSRVGGQPEAWDLRADGQVNVQWLPYFGITGRATAQYADQTLLTYEDFSVGNLTIVRGYDPSAVIGDRGIGGSLQGNLGAFPLNDIFAVSGYGFFDIAHVQNVNNVDPEQDDTLRSVGGGLVFSLSLLAQWNLDLTYAHPLDAVSLLATRPPPDEYLLNLTVSL
jgi:hemolysin activation/secretion protein